MTESSPPTPIRVAHYLPRIRLEEGGVVRAVLDFCGIFAARGMAVTLITGDATDVPGAWRTGAPGTPRVVEIAPPRPPLETLPKASVAQVEAVFNDADVVHLHEMWSPSNVQMVATARQVGVPYVLSIHGMLDDWSMAQRPLKKRIYLTVFGNRILRDAAAIHCTAEAELDQSSRWYPRAKGRVLPALMDVELFANLPGPDKAKAQFPPCRSDLPKLLFLSRVHLKKGVERLIETAAELKRRRIDCVVLIAGPGEAGYLRQLNDLVAREALTDRVHFLGMVRGQTKLSLYQAADLFVLPTSQENFGLVLLESMACGTPVVTTRGVDIWKELESAGATISDATKTELADSIAGLLADRNDLQERGAKGRRWVFENLDSDGLTHRYESLYRDTMK